MRLFQAVLLVSSFHVLDAQLHSAALENFGPSSQGAGTYGVQNDFSSHLLLPPSSPDCWLNAIQDLYPQNFHRNGNGQPPLDFSTCAKMDTHHQQALGLRLTKCNLETMGRSLLTTEDDNSCDDLHHPNGVKKCLSNLSDTAATTYMYFSKDVYYLCTRLLQESVTNRYSQTTQDLEQVSRLAETLLQNILQNEERMTEKALELQEQMKNILQQQIQSSAAQALELQEQLQAKQQEDLHRHKEELQSLADALQTTKASIQPWTQLVDLIFLYVPFGFSMLKILASMLGTMIIIMMLTPHKQLRRTRLKLFAVALCGGLGEMVLLWLENENDIQLTTSELLELSDCLQNFLMSFFFACYLSGLLSFCCGWNRDPRDDEGGEDDQDAFQDQVAHLRRETELQDRMRLHNYQQHWAATVAHQRLQQHQHEQLQATLPKADMQSNHPQLMSSLTPPPQLIQSPESTVVASTSPFVAAPWNAPPSPWTPHSTIPLYSNASRAIGNFNIDDASNHNNNNEFVRPTETIDFSPDEMDDEEEETDETRDDSVSNNRKRPCSDMEESIDGQMDHERDLPVPKKPRSAGQETNKSKQSASSDKV